MARQDRAPREGGARSSIYDDITSRIIAELEAGRLPWVQPWGTASAKAPLALPRNAATQRPYSGINILILWGAVVQQGYLPGIAPLTSMKLRQLPDANQSRANCFAMADRIVTGCYGRGP